MAGLTTTQTFSDGDTVTAAKLNNIISNASIDAGAINNAKLATDAVQLVNMANASVDTNELVDDAVSNAKLDDMGARTVKANATNASANPTDVSVGGNKLLAGTTNSINAVSFTDDLELDASDSAATKIKAAASLIGGKASVTADELDEILIKDATDGALKRATVKTAVQSQVATTGTSGVSRLASKTRAIDPSTAGTVDADVITVNESSSMLIKAGGNFTTSGTALSSGQYFNGSLARNSLGNFTFTFTVGLRASTAASISVFGFGYSSSTFSSSGGANPLNVQVASSSASAITFNTYYNEDGVNVLQDPDGSFQFFVLQAGS